MLRKFRKMLTSVLHAALDTPRGIEPERVAQPIVPPPAPPVPRTPRFVIFIDAENVTRTYRSAGGHLQPTVIRDKVREFGTIAFGFAFANADALSPRTKEDLTLAGFPLMHCTRVTNGTPARKDTVDESIQDAIARFLMHTDIEGIVLVTDDQNFAQIIANILDHNRRCIVLTPRIGGSLSRITETHVLPLTRRAAPTSALWTPDDAIDILSRYPREDGPVQEQAQSEFSIRAPLVAHVISSVIRGHYRHHSDSGAGASFRGLLSSAQRALTTHPSAPEVDDGDLRLFLEALVSISIIKRIEVEKPEGRRTQYVPDWTHPFCERIIAPIKRAQEAGGLAAAPDASRAVDDPPATTGVA